MSFFAILFALPFGLSDVRMLNELKKILEIEGLLEKYGRLFDNRKNLSGVYPKNNYSGLNSLRARLRNRHWDGKSPLANDSLANLLHIRINPKAIQTIP